jgi:hypothetical protein
MSSSTVARRSDSSVADPDGAMMELLAPDGYYAYLGVEKPPPSAAVLAADPLHRAADDPKQQQQAAAAAAAIDEDAVRRRYRKLSLQHHPDKPGGDADTFRLLNRAQRVLLTPKLRRQYDALGIDLDDDDEHHGGDDGGDDDRQGREETSTAQGIIQEIASQVLTGVVQLGVRTRTYAETRFDGPLHKNVSHFSHWLFLLLFQRFFRPQS